MLTETVDELPFQMTFRVTVSHVMPVVKVMSLYCLPCEFPQITVMKGIPHLQSIFTCKNLKVLERKGEVIEL